MKATSVELLFYPCGSVYYSFTLVVAYLVVDDKGIYGLFVSIGVKKDMGK